MGGLCLWGTWRQSANESVPAPVDEATPRAPWWWDHLAAQCRDFAENAGTTALMLPPVHKTNSGSHITGDGYGFLGDHYDIGSKQQAYSVPTRFGSREQLLRLCAVAAANGIDVYHDLVLHQMQNPGNVRFLGSDGKTMNGRFPKRASYFCNSGAGEVPHDDVMGDPDWAFGTEFSYEHALPRGELPRLTIDAVDWLMRTTDARGARIDAAKGLNAGFLKNLAESHAMRGRYAVMEFADGNAQNLVRAVYGGVLDRPPGVEGALAAFDFDGHYNKIKAMCENAGRFDMRGLAGGFSNMAPMAAATFVDNPDTDTNGFAQVAFNKIAGYFVLMTMYGYPFPYYRDRSTDRGCYGLRAEMDNLAWIQRVLVNGPMVVRYADHDLFVHERTGAPGALCALNNSPWGGWREQWVQTEFGPNRELKDYTGHAGNLWTDAQGRVNLGVPRNVNGLGYVVYAPVGLDRAMPTSSRATTQTVFGAADLDVGPLRAGDSVRAGSTIAANGVDGRIWVQEGSWIELAMRLNGSASYEECTMTVMDGLDGDDEVLGRVVDHAGRVRARRTGWHSVYAALGGPRGGTAAYELDLTYTAPKGI